MIASTETLAELRSWFVQNYGGLLLQDKIGRYISSEFSGPSKRRIYLKDLKRNDVHQIIARLALGEKDMSEFICLHCEQTASLRSRCRHCGKMRCLQCQRDTCPFPPNPNQQRGRTKKAQIIKVNPKDVDKFLRGEEMQAVIETNDNGRYSKEDKDDIIDTWRKESAADPELTMNRFAESLGLVPQTVARWITAAESKEAKPKVRRKRKAPKDYTEAERKATLEELDSYVANGGSVTKFCQESGIYSSAIYRWRDELKVKAVTMEEKKAAVDALPHQDSYLLGPGNESIPMPRPQIIQPPKPSKTFTEEEKSHIKEAREKSTTSEFTIIHNDLTITIVSEGKKTQVTVKRDGQTPISLMM